MKNFKINVKEVLNVNEMLTVKGGGNNNDKDLDHNGDILIMQ